jgi:NAD(P)-dependent dehydrogenase (short-subunit alcohol dehydrogenase family)
MTTNTRLALVTGGASGLGLAIAGRFIKDGIRTVIIGRNEEKLNAARKTLGELCIPYCFDLNELTKIPTMVREVEQTHGPIDILVNNAGIHLKKPMLEVSDEEFQKIITTNLIAVFSLTRETAKNMVKRERGNILLISSMAAQYGIPLVIAYTAAKSAIEGMTKAMAVELSPKGIRVNCIAPGFIKTAMSSGAMDDDPQRKQKAMSRTPLGKFGCPENIADAAHFLVSDEASYITGTVLPVDGGNAIGF